MQQDIIHGGKGDRAKPSDFDAAQLKMGIKVEMEHTKSRKIAREIAMDHLSEDPRYYTKLKKVHKEHASLGSSIHALTEMNTWLAEAAPPPFKDAERKAAGMSTLQRRSGAKITPPPIPDAAKKPKVLAQSSKKVIMQSPMPKGNKDLGIKRGFSMHTAAGSKGNPEAKLALGWAKDKVAARAAKGESMGDIAEQARAIVNEAQFKLKAMKPMKAIKGLKAMKPIKAIKPVKAMKPMKRM